MELARLNWWRSITTAIAFAAAIALVATVVAVLPIARRAYREHRENAIAPLAATDDEFRQVVVAALAHYRGLQLRRQPPLRDDAPLMLVDQSYVICGAHEEDEPAPDGCTSLDSDNVIASPVNELRIPLRLRRELGALNRRSSPLPTITVPWIRTVSDAVVREAFDDKSSKIIHEYFAVSAGLVHVTRVAMSADRSHALVYMTYNDWNFYGTSTLYYLKRRPGGWEVELSEQVWIS